LKRYLKFILAGVLALSLIAAGLSCSSTPTATSGPIAQLEQRVDDLEGAYANLANSVPSKAQVDTINAQIATINSSIVTLQGQITSPNVRLSQVEADIVALQKLIGDVSAINTKLSALETKVNAITPVDISGLQTTVTGLQASLTALQTKATAHDAAIAALDSELDTTAGSIRADITLIQSNITGLKASVTALQGQVAGIAPQGIAVGSITSNLFGNSVNIVSSINTQAVITLTYTLTTAIAYDGTPLPSSYLLKIGINTPIPADEWHYNSGVTVKKLSWDIRTPLSASGNTLQWQTQGTFPVGYWSVRVEVSN